MLLVFGGKEIDGWGRKMLEVIDVEIAVESDLRPSGLKEDGWTTLFKLMNDEVGVGVGEEDESPWVGDFERRGGLGGADFAGPAVVRRGKKSSRYWKGLSVYTYDSTASSIALFSTISIGCLTLLLSR